MVDAVIHVVDHDRGRLAAHGGVAGQARLHQPPAVKGGEGRFQFRPRHGLPDLGQVTLRLLQEPVGPEEEHSAVPEVPARRDVLPSADRVRLLDEPLYAMAIGTERVAELGITPSTTFTDLIQGGTVTAGGELTFPAKGIRMLRATR